ncbi:hypothetical protein JOH52_000824 [Sinorhizobium meliloti]|uniref:hypothetical protein n=1 Tax=Rhizobium meliloti TaxID=382 RepID=UPI000D1175AF|nr:hypothetical protein [Sinorhizobium meliloti]MBP2464803.1 hypothetical protein [Sinorhizobium meliloti]MQW83424.1 hypothetical protein [Sinorhizobium meliloti]PST29509.1 hypothetical protein C7U62_02660 [Mesorhizobium loti]GEC36473.1 hypothetical protein EME01_05450 [Sinorhizobium meliloti]
MKYTLTALAITSISAWVMLCPYTALSADEHINTVAAVQNDSVIIVEDAEVKAFRFMIDGLEVARLDSTGLHVRKGLSYGGSITDYDSPGFDAHIAQKAKAE